jgi:hypothetical protein
MTADPLPIEELVERRRREINLSKADVVRRCGHKNVSKGLRRLGALYAGEFEHAAGTEIISRLPEALEIDQETIQAVVSTTKQIVDARERAAAAKREAAWRAAFKPHAYLVGEHSTPTQITIYGITGGPDRWLLIALDTTLAHCSTAYPIRGRGPRCHSAQATPRAGTTCHGIRLALSKSREPGC